MSPDKYLIILYNRTRPGPFRVLSVTCQLIKTGLYSSLFSPSLSNLVIKSATPYVESIFCRWYYAGEKRTTIVDGQRKNKQRRFKIFVKTQRSKIIRKCLMSINHAAKICWSILFYFFPCASVSASTCRRDILNQNSWKWY